MAEVVNIPVEPVDRRGRDRKEKSSAEENANSPSPPPPPRRRERRDERDFDRPPNQRRGGGDYYDREYKRRRSSMSPPPPPLPYRERRRSPPPFKRSRRDDGVFDGRRGSPRGDRRFGYEFGGGYDREMGGRPPFPEDRPPGRYMGRGGGGFQGGPPGTYSTSSAF